MGSLQLSQAGALLRDLCMTGDWVLGVLDIGMAELRREDVIFV